MARPCLKTPQIPSACTPAGGSAWLAVTDDYNHRVQVVTLSGEVVRVLTADAANGLGRFGNCLHGITVCVDALLGDPELVVADTNNNRVVGFRLDGSAARVVCGAGAGRQVIRPAGLVVTGTGNLWVVEYQEHRLSLFR
jgi:hypothetical protein